MRYARGRTIGDDLYFERRGCGEPLLLIMGMAGHHNTCGRDRSCAQLGEHFDVVTFDNRGIGDSTDVPGQFTIVDLANDAVAVLEPSAGRRAHVMGISLGGMIAQELVLDVPERVRRLVIGCSYCGGAGSIAVRARADEDDEAMSSGDLEAGGPRRISGEPVADLRRRRGALARRSTTSPGCAASRCRL